MNVPVYGFVEFRGLERSALAGMMSVLDIHTWRDLYGYLTPERAAEIRKLKERAGARPVAREDAEAALFGGGRASAPEPAASPADLRRVAAARRRERQAARGTTSSRGATPRPRPTPAWRSTPRCILDDPRRIPETMPLLVEAAGKAGMQVKAVTWLDASGIVGQSMGLLRMVLYLAVLIIFAVALVIINNAMVMATLQRVKEIGTMRAIGAQRRFVLVLVVVEVVTTGLVFGGLGALVGILIVHAIGWTGGHRRHRTTPCTSSSPARPSSRAWATASLLTSVAIVFLVSILSALYPAVLAMRVTPLEAMQSDE